MTQNNFTLGIPGFEYKDLYDPARLHDLHDVFTSFVESNNSELHRKFEVYRQNQGVGIEAQEISDLLVKMGPYVGQFVARLFNISDEHQVQRIKIKDEIDTIFTYKREVVAKLNATFKHQNVSDWDIPATLSNLDLLIEASFPEADQDQDPEHRVARVGAFLARIANHFKLISKGKASEFENVEQEVQKLRDTLAGHEPAGPRAPCALLPARFNHARREVLVMSARIAHELILGTMRHDPGGGAKWQRPVRENGICPG